jgi:epoxyqueuosine reductase
LTGTEIRELAGDCGFELAGVARALPAADAGRYREWAAAGYAGEMLYLTDRRAEVREDPRLLLPSARSMICVGKLYHTPAPLSTEFSEEERGWISRYAWGDDYHERMREGLRRLEGKIRGRSGEPLESRILVDTAPLLERSYARLAGLGWIGRNTCLINQRMGSWFFLGELLLTLELPADEPPTDRCGTCTRCIDACPTAAIVPTATGYTLDARRCISYFTIELRGTVPEPYRGAMGAHIFGCDICQDVCPWNRRAPVTADPAYQRRAESPALEKMAAITEAEFRELFRASPVSRARYQGFLRNVATAMGNRGLPQFREPLERMAAGSDPVVAEHARWALKHLP